MNYFDTLTPEEVETRLTLTTGGVNMCSIPMMILDYWGFAGTPSPKDRSWMGFVNRVRVEILSLPEKGISNV